MSSMRGQFGTIVLMGLFSVASIGQSGFSRAEEKGKLRIVVFGAHPDDAEIRAGGTAALWAAKGHHVQLVSVTNGDIGHYAMSRPALAARRLAEARAADKILGAASRVLDIHDGELEPTLANRRTITRVIREWKADIVIAHRPNDYHPDHRYVGVLVQDSAYMVTVPKFCPETPHLRSNPVFLYSEDGFERPNPFRPDIVVAIDDVIDKKVEALMTMESQFVEGGANGSEPKDAAEREARRKRGFPAFKARSASIAGRNSSSFTGKRPAKRSATPRRSRSANTAGGRTPKRFGSCSPSTRARSNHAGQALTLRLARNQRRRAPRTCRRHWLRCK
jgi:LmbE family N-acetylglucosaminyl deacetylase